MWYYRDIPFWTNRNRCKELIAFRNSLIGYFNSIKRGTWGDVIESHTSEDFRHKINLELAHIHEIINAAGITPNLTVTPPPAIGGYIHNVDVILNIFNHDSLQLPPQKIIDYLDITIGKYTHNHLKSLIRTFNPFWWLKIGITQISRIPFIVLGSMGLNREKIETSLIGRIIKGSISALTTIGVILTVMEKLGYLEI